jgi:hypothetical protein
MIEKLLFSSNLTDTQLRVKGYLVEWICKKDPIQIGKLCSLITGVNHPRGVIKVILVIPYYSCIIINNFINYFYNLKR